MSIGSLGGLIGSAAGAPLSQTGGSDAERTARETAAQERAIDGAARSEKAAGIGTTEQDQEASERDADGRRPWEFPPETKKDAAAEGEHQSRDPTGQCGTHLDLTG
jgi:predicted Zn-dependent protease